MITNLKKISILLLAGFACVFSAPLISNAQTTSNTQTQTSEPAQTPAPTQTSASNSSFFKAKIVQVSSTKEEIAEDGTKTYIQTVELKGLENPWKDQLITVDNSEFNTLGPKSYQKGDVMLMVDNKDDSGKDHFVIADFVRETPLYILGFIFIALVALIGKKKGLMALLSLILSFLVIVYFMIPQIANGADPVLISAIGAIIITIITLYLTYGFNYFSHLGAISVIASLLITVIMSQFFSDLTKLTGKAEESVTYLTQLLGPNFNARGLLLAGFIIGALGILDDVIINQLSLIEELHKADKNLSSLELFKRGLKVGVDHISAIVNTLFLAYTGASLPLLLLFVADKSVQYSFTSVINMEIITTEIVRTLTGSIGIVLSVPISTFFAAVFIPRFIKKRNAVTHMHHAHVK